MRLTKNFPSPNLADKKRDQVGFSIFWLVIGKKIPFWSKMSNLYQKGNFFTLWAHGIFPKPSFLDSPVNLGIVGEIISECTCPQTADQPANLPIFWPPKLQKDQSDLYKLIVRKQTWSKARKIIGSRAKISKMDDLKAQMCQVLWSLV